MASDTVLEAIDPSAAATVTGGLRKLPKREPDPKLLEVVRQLADTTDKTATLIRSSQDQAQQQSTQAMMQMLPQMKR